MLGPFKSGSFVGEALNNATFFLNKGSGRAIASVDTPLSTRYPPPPQIALYVYHEFTYEIILTATIFFTPVNSFEWHVVEGFKFERVKTGPKHDVIRSES